MRHPSFLVGFILTVFSSCAQKSERYKPDPAAVEYNNQAMALATYIDEPDSSKKALSLLDHATEIDSNYFLGHYNKLMFYYKLKQVDNVLKTTNKLIQIRPTAHDLYLQAGTLYFQLGDTTSANRHFNKSLEICNVVLDTMNKKHRDFVQLTMNKALCLILLNDTLQANGILKKLHDSMPSSTEFDLALKQQVEDLIGKNRMEVLPSIKHP